MKQKCNHIHCEKKAFQNMTKCALHCEKKSYSHDFQNGVLSEFYNALIEDTIEQLFKWHHSYNLEIINVESVRNYLKGTNSVSDVADFCHNSIIVFNYIYFPSSDNRDSFNYQNVLKKIKGVHFNTCKFAASLIEIPEVEVFFQDCEFNQVWSISQAKILGNVNNVMYQNCKFLNNVTAYLEDEQNGSFDVPLFNDCIFEAKLSFNNMRLSKPIFNNTAGTKIAINQLLIENCEINAKFILNNLTTDFLLMENSEFKGKVELKDSVINEAEIINTNFKSLFDSFSTKYGKFYCFKSIFSDFVGFEKCQFAALQKDNKLNQIAKFKFATFLSFTNFRNATFHQGLDLADTNLKEPPNFLNIQLLSNNTNRETFRIIKNAFDKIGNHIEGNKFFALEMNQYKQELHKGSPVQERFIFWFNKVASDFGQDYFRPIGWIIILSVIYYFLILGYEYNLLYKLMPCANEAISWISSFLNGVAANIIPFKPLLKKGMEFVSLVFYIIYSSLIWQTIVAIKRHTRRQL